MTRRTWVIGMMLTTGALAHAATNDLTSLLQQGLFEEEANRNLAAAITNYQSLVTKFDKDRQIAATAVFRLGECYRKLGQTNAAALQYQRVIREFSDQQSLVTLSRQNLAGLGVTTSSVAVAQPPSTAAPTTDEEQQEIRRIQTMTQNSPDLINAPDGEGLTPLQNAAKRGQLRVAQYLIDNGASVNRKGSEDRTPLHQAALAGHKAMAELLLSRGADINAKDKLEYTPLLWAVWGGFNVVTETLLAHKADVNARNSEGLTPLHIAARSGQAALVELLLSKGAGVNAEDKGGRTPLSYAVQKRDEATVKALIAAHADPDAGRLDLPLSLAAYFGDIATLELLLAKGANPNTKSVGDWNLQVRQATSPLFHAVIQRHPEAVKLLIQFKADPTTPRSTGDLLLFRALSDAEILKTLLEGGADPNKRQENHTLLATAVLGNVPEVPGKKAILELLLKHGADVDALDDVGNAALHWAVATGKKEFVSVLLANKANVNVRGRNGNTPLHWAVRYANKELALFLLANKADVNARNESGMTPLDLAKSGLTGSLRNFDGNEFVTSPVDKAAMAEIVPLLRQHGALEDLPRLDRIEVRRPSANVSHVIFSKGTNDWNRFTLLELVAVQYGVLASEGGSPSGGSPSRILYRFDAVNMRRQPMNSNNPLPFPDLAHVLIRHPTKDGKGWQELKVDLAAILQSGDCSKDILLQWGDIVEIPELDHPVSETWAGLPNEAFVTFEKCLSRSVDIVVKGRTTKFNFGPSITIENDKAVSCVNNQQLYLAPILSDSKLLLASSDTARVKVKRHDPATGKAREWVVDCRTLPDFWLRDGDVIEVPDKP